MGGFPPPGYGYEWKSTNSSSLERKGSISHSAAYHQSVGCKAGRASVRINLATQPGTKGYKTQIQTEVRWLIPLGKL